MTKIATQPVGLKRTIGLSAGVSVILGMIIGSGIFVSPKSVLLASNSIGLCLILWVVCGLVSLLAALSFAELGTFITESGSEFIYIYRGFSSLNPELGRLLAFVYVWSTAIIGTPTSLAGISLACAQYTLSSLFGKCALAPALVKFTAVLIMFICSAINAYSVKLTNKILEILTLSKLGALVVILLGGFSRLGQGFTRNFENSFDGTNTNILQISNGFYGGLWAYSGWNNLNCLTEEIIKPKRNLPLAILISLPMCIIVYLLVNVSYFTVMSKSELLASSAVALFRFLPNQQTQQQVQDSPQHDSKNKKRLAYSLKQVNNLKTWSQTVLPSYFQWFVPLSVVLSTFSATLASQYGSSRIYFVAGRQELLLKMISMVHTKRHTPLVSILFTFVIAVLFLIPSSLDTLIFMRIFTRWLFIGLSVAALIIMRFTMREQPRTLKIPILLHAFVVFVSIYLVFAPLGNSAKIEFLGVIGLLASSMLFYVPFIYFKLRTPYLNHINYFVQNLFEVAAPTDQPN